MKVNISEIFTSIQGEGRFAGHPAVFIRFAGCSNKCEFCDTKHANHLDPVLQVQRDNLHSYNLERLADYWTAVTVQEVYEYVGDLIERSSKDPKKRIQMVVITGGEPFEQPEALGELCVKLPYLIKAGVSDHIQVCIETSGAAPLTKPTDSPEVTDNTAAGVLHYIFNSEYCFLTVSPKPRPVHLEYIYAANQLKFLVGCDPSSDIRIPSEVLEHITERCEGLTFQPIWYDRNDLREESTRRAIAKAYKYGGTLSTQIHKYLNIR